MPLGLLVKQPPSGRPLRKHWRELIWNKDEELLSGQISLQIRGEAVIEGSPASKYIPCKVERMNVLTAKSALDLSNAPRVYFDRRTGGLKIISLSAGAGHDVLVDGKFVGVAGGPAKSGRTERVNRLVDSELASQELPWLDSATDVPVKKNLSPDWTLEGSNTAFIKSAAAADEKPVTAVFNCPVEGAGISVTAGRTYCFQALFGLHRAEGSVNLVFLDQEGESLKTFKAPISTNHQGGRTIAQYYRVDLSAQAPAGAAKLRIEIVKGLTLKGADSFLFFAHPALVQAAAMADYKWIERDLPDAAVVDLFGLADAAYVMRDVAIPGEALDGGFHNVAVRDCETGATSPSVPVALPDSMRCTGQVYGIEGSSLTVQIGLPPSWTNRVTLSLWVDGQPDSRTFLSEAGSGTVRLPLASENCDGRPHVFEIRLGKSGQLIGAHAAIGPVSTTPWDALQRYAGMPLPSHISPIAAYRYASLASPHPASKEADAPEFHELHDILVEGFFRPRKSYRKLPFKRHASPDVSIVIPVHNKFDVTYVCLAGLLFARTRASFEVIVVDDGSSDTTCKIEDIAPGVVYVRNEVAQGFVGACNAGAAVARGRYIVFLNNDTEPTADWLDELLFVFANFDGAGLAGSKLIYADGYLQEAGGIVWETGDPWNYGRRGNASDPRFSYTRICDYLSGAAVMIPADLWQELGGFSQEFAPAYFEDTDLAFKVRNAGRKVVFARARWSSTTRAFRTEPTPPHRRDSSGSRRSTGPNSSASGQRCSPGTARSASMSTSPRTVASPNG